MLSLAVFYKTLKDLVVEQELESFDAQSGLLTRIKQKQNAGRARVKGIELGLVKNSLDFLPTPFDNFGLSANVAWIDAHVRTQTLDGEIVTFDHLPRQPEFMANVLLFYSFTDAKGEVGVGYNVTGSYADSATLPVNSDPRNETVWRRFEQWDAHYRYQLGPQLTFKAQIRNLFDQTRQHGDPDQTLIEHEVVFGRSVWLGLVYRF